MALSLHRRSHMEWLSPRGTRQTTVVSAWKSSIRGPICRGHEPATWLAGSAAIFHLPECRQSTVFSEDRMRRRQFLKLSAAAAAGLAAPRVAWPQAYPARPVRVIVTFAPGGPTDVAARLIAQKLSESLGRQFYVENVAGASGNIGTAQAAKAMPDGYTLLVTVNNLIINPPLFGNVTYDPYKDFDPVALAVSFSSAFAVHPSVPATSVRELIDYIKANPGKLSFASPGLGTPSHLLGEQLKVTLG